MSKKYLTNNYTPQNPEKYTGNYPIVSRSSWEWDFMVHLDLHPDVLQWASEPIQIPYRDPLTGYQKIYIPDFLATFLEKDGRTVTKLIEVKPMHEAMDAFARNGKDAALRARNDAKWGAALAWCMRHGAEFQVITEGHVYDGHALREGRSAGVRKWAPAQVKAAKPKKPKISKAKKQLTEMTKKIRATRAKVGKVAKIKPVAKVRKVRKI